MSSDSRRTESSVGMMSLANLGVSSATGYSHAGTWVSQCLHSVSSSETKYSKNVSSGSSKSGAVGLGQLAPSLLFSGGRSFMSRRPPERPRAAVEEHALVVPRRAVLAGLLAGLQDALEERDERAHLAESHATRAPTVNPPSRACTSMRITSRRASTYFSKRGVSAADSCLARVSSHDVHHGLPAELRLGDEDDARAGHRRG